MSNFATVPMQDVKQVLFDEDALARRIRELGEQITAEYRGKDLVLLCVLKGSMFFAADLMRHVEVPLTLDFIAISSYGESTNTSGVVRIVKDLEEPIEGRHVLIVEDIVDTGLTLGYLIRTLRLRKPASIRTATLLDKPVRRILEVPIDYRGFEIGDHFVVGYGLDYASHYRTLPAICILKEEVLAKS